MMWIDDIRMPEGDYYMPAPPISVAYEVVLTDHEGRIIARTCRRSTVAAAEGDAFYLNLGKSHDEIRWSVAVIEERYRPA